MASLVNFNRCNCFYTQYTQMQLENFQSSDFSILSLGKHKKTLNTFIGKLTWTSAYVQNFQRQVGEFYQLATSNSPITDILINFKIYILACAFEESVWTLICVKFLARSSSITCTIWFPVVFVRHNFQPLAIL